MHTQTYKYIYIYRGPSPLAVVAFQEPNNLP